MTIRKRKPQQTDEVSYQEIEALVQEMEDLHLSQTELLAILAEKQKRIRVLEQRIAGAADQLEARAQQVHALNETLQQAEDTMPRWTSQMLHDDVQQMLYGLRLQLLSLASLLSASLPDTAKPQAEEALRELLSSTDCLTATVKNLLFVLSPPVRPNAMLPELLEALAARIEEMYGLEVDVVKAEPTQIPKGELPHGIGNVLFRVLRELLINIATLTGAERAEIELGIEGEMLRVQVNCPGDRADLTPMLAENPMAVDINSIQKRLQAAGGRLVIENEKGPDARIGLVLPLSALAGSST